MTEPSAAPQGAHLVVLIHGLWGNPTHLASLAAGLRTKHPEDALRVLVAERNTSRFTYDGIEVGGERVTQEIEDELERLKTEGVEIAKISIVGYSLGGLIARYCIGLLYGRGRLDTLQPVNFTAFASPFLGVRSPTPGYRGKLWNLLGAHSISTSGRQLFLTDTGRPLLSVLADPDSIFMKGLARFKNRTLYANVQNDRSAPYWTTGVSAKDPYVDLHAVDMRFVSGYEPVVADPEAPVAPKRVVDNSLYGRLVRGSSDVAAALPFLALRTVFLPLGATLFAINACYQTFQSRKRVKLHNESGIGRGFGMYRLPLLAEGPFDAFGPPASQDHLPGTGDVAPGIISEKALVKEPTAAFHDDDLSAFPTLELTPDQFEMIENLDRLGIRKYHVLISLVQHSHAAIIVRWERKAFREGHIVIKHWVEEEFEV